MLFIFYGVCMSIEKFNAKRINVERMTKQMQGIMGLPCKTKEALHIRKKFKIDDNLVLTNFDVVVFKAVEEATKGDMAAAKMLFYQTIGKPVTNIELTGAGGEPLHIVNLITQAELNENKEDIDYAELSESSNDE